MLQKLEDKWMLVEVLVYMHINVSITHSIIYNIRETFIK